MPERLSQAEIDERAAILRRFREALLRQRERFSRYLQMLEQQPRSGNRPDGDEIEIHVKMEQEIVREIASFEQVIEPLHLMYSEHDPQGAADLPNLKAALERTRNEVVRRTAHNRDLLRAQVDSLRSEIEGLRILRRQQSLYATPAPTTVDISA